MTERRFDAKKDTELITTGKYFYCHSHLCAVEIEKKSENPCYCVDCYRVLKADDASPVEWHRNAPQADSDRLKLILVLDSPTPEKKRGRAKRK